jgi:hypothetical protein
MGTKEIQRLICVSEVLKFNIPCENVSPLIWSHEADVLSINKNDYLTEFEVKVSRSDFLVDKKKLKWRFYNLAINHKIANRFFYVCPEGLISESEVPENAGLIYANRETLTVIKPAPLIHKIKCDRLRMLNKFCTMMSQRACLGKCMMTYKNDQLKNHN